MKVVEHFTRAGDVLFRWRSYLPLILLPLFVASFIGFHYPYTGFLVLDVVEDYWVTGGLHFDLLWTSVFILSAFFFAVMRTWKKRMAR